MHMENLSFFTIANTTLGFLVKDKQALAHLLEDRWMREGRAERGHILPGRDRHLPIQTGVNNK